MWSEWREDIKKESIETIVGLLVAAGLLFAGYMAAELANDNIDTMIKKTTWSQEIIAAH